MDKPDLAAGAGINTSRLSAFSWILASFSHRGGRASSLSPLLQLDPSHLTSLSVAALSVALAGTVSLLDHHRGRWPGAGRAASEITGYAPQGSVIANGLVPALPFFLLAGLLLFGRTETREQAGYGQSSSRSPRQRAPIALP